ncbi:MAG: hypothetical protein JNJ54_11760 [Myxococcaceae bacterium]|nr:hypothetical protein [Myxococcaceae bacterium]
MTRPVTMALLLTNVALAVVHSRNETPARPLRASTEPVLLHLPDGRDAWKAALARQPDRPRPSAVAWTNAFRSAVAGPTPGAPAGLHVEAAPSPLHPGATLLRVVVQADHRQEPDPSDLRLRLDFFPLEVVAWRAPEQPTWESPQTPLLVTLAPLEAGTSRVLFVEVDTRLRFGAALGVVTLTAGPAGRLAAPLDRGPASLDDASLDFRFFAAVFATAESSVVRVDAEGVLSLLADSAAGQAEREAFEDLALRTLNLTFDQLRARDVGWERLGY